MADYFPTEYASAAAEVIALLADVVEGYGKAEAGEVDAPTGYFALVILDDTCDLDFADTSTNYPRGDLVGETAREYGVTAEDVRGAHIVTHDSQGFVSVETFDTAEEAQREFDRRYAVFARGRIG